MSKEYLSLICFGSVNMHLTHYSSLEEVISHAPLVLGIGVFDGLHLGHLDLLKQLCDLGQKHQAKTAIWTFDSKLPKPGFSRLLRESEFLQLLAENGVEQVHRMEFIDEISQMSAEEFLSQVLIQKMKVKGIVLGEDARLGKNRSCSAAEFKEIASKHGVEVQLVPLFELNGEVVSSTKIRECIKKGDFHKTQAFLGRPFVLTGKVVQDQQLARTLGFPTANIFCDDLTLPPNGVYRCLCDIEGAEKSLTSIAYLGSRPTVKEGQGPVLEVHIKNFERNLYDKQLRVYDFEKIRAEKKFENLEALKAQLQIDIQKV